MRIASTNTLRQAVAPGWLAARANDPVRACAAAWANEEAPDASYWTPYDYFMIEREARALRRAAMAATIARVARRLGVLAALAKGVVTRGSA
jgi:hypothetical protein